VGIQIRFRRHQRMVKPSLVAVETRRSNFGICLLGNCVALSLGMRIRFCPSPSVQMARPSSVAVGITLKVWNLRTEQLRTLTGDSNEVWSVALSPMAKPLLVPMNITKIWNMPQQNCGVTFLGIQTVWSPSVDGQTLASGSKDRRSKFESAHWEDCCDTFRRVRSVAISPDGQTLASGSWDQTHQNLESALDCCVASGHSMLILSPLSRWSNSPAVVTTAQSSFGICWSCWLSGHSSNVNSVTFDATGKILVRWQ